LKEIGEYLRRVREEKNISIKDVQEATKIRLCYLEALDRGEFALLPGEVYLKGFIVSYANAIGLNGQEILDRYYQLKAAQEEQVRLAESEKAEAEKKRASENPNWFQGIYLGIAVILLVGLLASFFMVSYFHHEPLTEASSITEDSRENNGEADSKTTYPAPVTIYAEFLERTWVEAKADGELLFDGRIFDALEPKQVWTAQRVIEVNLGNPAGISLTLNGKNLGLVGKRGVPILVRITPKGLETP
jgi:cytoskeletal protein RodZ